MTVTLFATDDRLSRFMEDAGTRNRLRLAIYRCTFLPPGTTADELIIDAVIAVRLGVREWPDGVDAFNFFLRTVRSMVSHFWEKEARMQPIVPDVMPQARTDSKYLRPHENLEAQAEYYELCEKMLALVADDPLAARVVKFWAREPSLKPKEVAEALGISMTEMRNVQKRLHRKLSPLRPKSLRRKLPPLRAEKGEVK